MITNGTLITKISAEKLVESGLDTITFSVDSSEPEPHDAIRAVVGSWEKAIEGMRYIIYTKRKHKNKELKVSLFVVVTATNYHLIDKIVALKPKLGFDGKYFLPPSLRGVHLKICCYGRHLKRPSDELPTVN